MSEAPVEVDQCPDDLNAAGHAPVCGGCSGKSLCQQSFNMIDPDIEDIRVRMNVIKHKLLVLSGKGGVGKSTFSAGLAVALAKQSYKVGILDIDICGPSIANMLGVASQSVVNTSWGWKPCESPHFKVKVMSVASLIDSRESAIIYKGPRKTHLIKRMLKETFWGKLDYLIIDTPPGTSDEHLTILRLLKNLSPDGALLISTPQQFSLNTIRKEIAFCSKMKLRIIGLIENMSYFKCPCCEERTQLFPSSGARELCQKHQIAYLGELPFNQKLCESVDQGKSVLADQDDAATSDNSLEEFAQTLKNIL